MRSGTIGDDGTLTVGSLSVAAPAPAGFAGSWTTAGAAGVHVLSGKGKVGDADAAFEWVLAENNPHTWFGGQWSSPREALEAAPPVSVIELPAGDLTYVNSAYETVPFAGSEVMLRSGNWAPITWRNGNEALTIWQWNADRVVLKEGEAGGHLIELHWWHPEQHWVPEDCSAAAGKAEVVVRPRVALSFDAGLAPTPGRLPGGSTGAVVPVFFDPHDVTDARYRDGAATSPADFAARARTIALGHSDPTDARHGNGGLAGTDLGGTIVVPTRYADEKDAMTPVIEALAETTVDMVPEADLKPKCEAWIAAEPAGRLGETTVFDGAFPNLLAAEGASGAPAGPVYAWPNVELTGRRKDVVQQTLSRIYLDRLEKKRGLTVLRIPLVASRNPLVPAAAESLLDPERQGNWTIQEEVARALAEIELLAEEGDFAVLSLGRLTDHWHRGADVFLVPDSSGALMVQNRSPQPIRGYTLIVDGTVVPVLEPEQEIDHELRDVPGGRQQTWVWFELPSGETKLRLEQPQAPTPSGVAWNVAAVE